ncbi:MAG: hypothetical protein EXR73_05125 [Myxococcales bacterium]|nr:hypothetical protein [Myxococcales bacterium]
MILARLWLFFLSLAATAALAIALLVPRPADRMQHNVVEPERVERARTHTELLLRENARRWVDVIADFARKDPRLAQALDSASRTDEVTDKSRAAALEALRFVLSQVSGAQRPEVALAIDLQGRVVARAVVTAVPGGMEEREYGDDLSGYNLVRDALSGYVRDDVWLLGGNLYRMAGAPVIMRELGAEGRYVGAVLIGDVVDLALARELEKRVGRCSGGAADEVAGNEGGGGAHCEPHVAFFAAGQVIVTSESSAVTAIAEEQTRRAATPPPPGDREATSFTVRAGERDFLVAVRPIPGEASAHGAYFAVFAPRSAVGGFAGALRGVTSDDLGFDRFPWVVVGGVLVLALALGMLLITIEGTRPLKRLLADAIALGQEETSQLDEDRHRGRAGTIARSVNLALERLGRAARVAAPRQAAAGSDGARRASAPSSAPPRASSSGADHPDLAFEPPPATAARPMSPGLPHGVRAGTFPVGSRPPAVPPPARDAVPRPRRETLLKIDEDVFGAELDALLARVPAGGAPGGQVAALGAAAEITQPNPEDAGADAATQIASRPAVPSPRAVPAVADNRQLFADFLALKRSCGEPTEGLTYERFDTKVRTNRDALIAKHGCKTVRFQVYVKDGKAALKATPVRG